MGRREADHIRQEIEENLDAIQGMKALFRAAREGDADKIRYIMSTSPRVDINSEDINRATALHMAAMNNRADAVAALIELGADIDHVDKSNATPLYTAVSRQGQDAAAVLIEAGADETILCGNGMAPLHASVVMDFQRTTKLLLENGADITLPTQNGQTAMELAEMYDNVQQIKLLQEVVSAKHTRRLKHIHEQVHRHRKPRTP